MHAHRSELYRDGVMYKALVLNLKAQFNITPPERPLHDASQGQMLGIGVNMAFKNDNHFNTHSSAVKCDIVFLSFLFLFSWKENW